MPQTFDIVRGGVFANILPGISDPEELEPPAVCITVGGDLVSSRISDLPQYHAPVDRTNVLSASMVDGHSKFPHLVELPHTVTPRLPRTSNTI